MGRQGRRRPPLRRGIWISFSFPLPFPSFSLFHYFSTGKLSLVVEFPFFPPVFSVRRGGWCAAPVLPALDVRELWFGEIGAGRRSCGDVRM